MRVVFAVLICCFYITSCATTLTKEVRKTKPDKFYYSPKSSCIKNLREAIYYIWKLENYTRLIEKAVWQ
ncbi:hypothetical protein F0310_04510 (plasmid) [Borrelia sp. A-FGy1]|uniref:hypothetical protein n=1 Tax=Borrelia sp. A-FGy1 TaxID=2608247 RepID=UPI0015F48FA8|nr:hypothetical protein [Borrelia sp. A-FGy1]QMU99680.1 hypothetical protein F0310_04510 [Borrelia sp. A-FGy1]